jgi:UDP-N-acetyl-D-mannosaminuronate dehydrogenase
MPKLIQRDKSAELNEPLWQKPFFNYAINGRGNTMRISIFGLGYVGAVCAGCLSARGHDVVGVDISAHKIDLINSGKSPIVEPGLEVLLQQGLNSGHLRGTTDGSK